MNSLPLSESTPMIGKGITRPMSARASTTHFRALFRNDRFSVQPVAMSVTVRAYCQTTSLGRKGGSNNEMSFGANCRLTAATASSICHPLVTPSMATETTRLLSTQLKATCAVWDSSLVRDLGDLLD